MPLSIYSLTNAMCRKNTLEIKALFKLSRLAYIVRKELFIRNDALDHHWVNTWSKSRDFVTMNIHKDYSTISIHGSKTQWISVVRKTATRNGKKVKHSLVQAAGTGNQRRIKSFEDVTKFSLIITVLR